MPWTPGNLPVVKPPQPDYKFWYERVMEVLTRVANGEGRLVSTGDLTPIQITEMKAHGRLYVDSTTHLGWAILPWDLTTLKDEERFERQIKQ